MRKVLATIFLLTACCVVKGNGFIMKIADELLFRVEAGSFVSRMSSKFFREETPILVFSSTRAVVFPSFKKVPTSVLWDVAENKLSIGYKIKEGLQRDAIFNLRLVACEEYETDAIRATGMEFFKQADIRGVPTGLLKQYDIRGMPFGLLKQAKFSFWQGRFLKGLAMKNHTERTGNTAVRHFFNIDSKDFNAAVEKIHEEAAATNVKINSLVSELKKHEKDTKEYDAIKNEYEEANKEHKEAIQRCNEIRVIEMNRLENGLGSLGKKAFSKSSESSDIGNRFFLPDVLYPPTNWTWKGKTCVGVGAVVCLAGGFYLMIHV